MDTFLPVAGMSLLVVNVINFLKYLRAKDTNGWFTQLVAWVAGVGVTALAAATDFADSVVIGGLQLGQMNFPTQVFVGMTVAAAGGYAVEIKKAIDQNDSAAKPDLVPKA